MTARRSKYGAVKQTVDGITFASKREAKRYQELRLLEKAGEIKDLVLQPKYSLHAPTRSFGRALIGHYVADFRYLEGPKFFLVVEDAKGFRTQLYAWKKRHVEAEHGIAVREV
jgi:hypothetical protein